MKIFLMITVISVLALVTDYYLYRRWVDRYKPRRFWRVTAIVYFILIDTAVVTALLIYRSAVDFESGTMLRATMWIIGLFFLHAGPKFVYALISLGDYIVQRKTKKPSRIFGYIGGLSAFLCAAVLLHGLSFGRTVVEVRQIELHFERLPESFDGLRVVQFSDNHIGTLINRDKFLERFVDSINMLNADVVINSGDIVNTHARELDPGAMKIFGRIRSRYGVFSVLGNHDLGIYIQDTVRYSPRRNIEELIEKQESLGWTMLVNQTAYIHNGTDSISVSGLNYPAGFSHNGHDSEMAGADLESTYNGLPAGIFNISITHAPQLWNEILEEDVADLTVAGHVHSMQLKLRLGKWKWSPARFMYDRWSGLYEEDGRYLYINDGAGYVMFPMRIGTKPEITLYTLRSK